MSAGIEEYRSRLRDALTTINQLKSKLESFTRERSEPIAIVGMGCRFPGGGDTPELFFDALLQGLDAVTEVPSSRWELEPPSDDPLKRSIRWGAFLKDVDSFDADFFGISPREAIRLDPQQRILLEVCWESLENAGIVPAKLIGSKTGVFLGLMTNDYAIVDAEAGRDKQDAYSTTGNGHCFPAGRISYSFGFQGPSMVVDTACSSSLVALHLAAQSLRNKECDLALVGGVNLMLSPLITEQFSKTRAFSPDGRCKTFDAGANGYARGEGCGVLVVMRLSDAQRNGNRILAIVRGSAVNQDGRSTGLTTPNVLAQEALIRSALANAGLAATEIGYVEAHGTGTPLGDPIEIDALRAAIGDPRPNDAKCMIGAVKTNIGHLEAAAGMAGLIKVTMMFNRSIIPRNCNFRIQNPRIDLTDSALELATRQTIWARTAQPRRAGISSFGMSGTNAHVILEEAPHAQAPTISAGTSFHLLPLSAKTAEALPALARSYADFFRHNVDVPLQDIVHTASLRRTHHRHRLAVVAGNHNDFATLLDAFANGTVSPGVTRGHPEDKIGPKIVFVFPGQGSQWLGMGKSLLATEPVFRTVLEACDAAIRVESGFSVLEQLAASEVESRMAEIDVVQPLLFALEVALAGWWQSWGVTPDCVVGHSMGEVAAAHVAGMLTLQDAVKIICRRSRILKKIRGRGAMALVELSMSDAEAAILDAKDQIDIAVNNGPRSTVLSGEPEALDNVIKALESKGVYCRRVKVDVASHSPQVDPLHTEMMSALQDISPKAGVLRLRSTVTGEFIEGNALTTAYWWDNLRQRVRFAQVIQSLIAEEHTIFIEISPHPILLPSITESLHAGSVDGVTIASTRRDSNEQQVLFEAIGTLHSHGYDIDFARHYAEPRSIVPLPTYPWQRQRYWTDPPRKWSRRALEHGEHPLLGRELHIAALQGRRIWEQIIETDTLPWLADHAIHGAPVFPGMGYVELAIAAARQPDQIVELRNVAFLVPLDVPKDDAIVIQCTLNGASQTNHFDIASRALSGTQWIQHSSATITTHSATTRRSEISIEAAKERCREAQGIDELYATFNKRGISYGPAFRALRELWLGDGEALGRIKLAEDVAVRSFFAHPALLDACLHCIASILPPGETDLYVPAAIEHAVFYSAPSQELWALVRRDETNTEPESPRFNISAVNLRGQTVFEMSGLRLQRISRLVTHPQPVDERIHVVEWREQAKQRRTRPNHQGIWMLVGTAEATEKIARQLESSGNSCIRVTKEHAFSRKNSKHFAIDLHDDAHWKMLLRDAFPAETLCLGFICISSVGLEAVPSVGHDPVRIAEYDVMTVLHVVQAMLKHDWRDAPKLCLITAGAQASQADADVQYPEMAALWGIGRTIALEHPELACTRIDLEAPITDDGIAQAVEEILHPDDEDQIAFRGITRLVPRLVNGCSNLGAGTISLRSDAAYLITGGLGGLGLAVAQWMVARGARRLGLVGRSAPNEMALAAIDRMTKSGARILRLQGDISNRVDVARMLSTLEDQMGPLAGIIHAAGILDDGLLINLDASQVNRTFAPKVAGAFLLDELTADRSLDFFVFYSSAAALLGSAGQGHYAAANAIMDALAHQRVARGKAAMSIQWGAVADVGLAAAQENRGNRLASRGIGALSIDEVLQAQEGLLLRPRPEIGYLRFSIRQWNEFNPRVARLPYTSELREEQLHHTSHSSGDSFLRELETITEANRQSALERHIANCLGRVLRIDADRIDTRAPFKAYGIDSLMSLEVRNLLEPSLGLRLSATLLFTYPTTEKLAEHLLGEMIPAMAPAPAVATTITTTDDSQIAAFDQVKDLSDEEAAALLEAKLLDLEDFMP